MVVKVNDLAFLITRRQIAYIIFLVLSIIGCILAHNFHGSNTPWQSIFQGVGVSLIASCIFGLFFVYIDFVKTSEEARIRMFMGYGIYSIYQKRNIIEVYDALLKNAQYIDVAGYSLRQFWEQNKSKIEKSSFSKVRMILVDPKSEASKNAEMFEGKVSGYYEHAIENIIEEIKSNIELKNNVEIRFIKHPIGSMIYRIDNDIFTGPYFINRSSVSTHTIHAKKQLMLSAEFDFYNEILKEFETLWDGGVNVFENEE